MIDPWPRVYNYRPNRRMILNTIPLSSEDRRVPLIKLTITSNLSKFVQCVQTYVVVGVLPTDSEKDKPPEQSTTVRKARSAGGQLIEPLA